jgi:transposase
MNKLEDVDGDALCDALGEASSAKAAKRLMIALAYADGVRVETLSERYDIPRSTVYSWLDRFEHQSINEAITDDSWPGRPSRLTASQRERLSDDLAGLPA